GNSVIEMFMASVALAVGAIPEGLPAAVTITLAIGVSRMAKRRAIIRKLPAVEALGSATVICSDKTGTLTENQMTVQKIYAGQETYDVTGSGYDSTGQIRLGTVEVPLASKAALKDCLLAGVLCNDSQLIMEQKRVIVRGDPTEGALIISARKGGVDQTEAVSHLTHLDSIPFESEHRYMATLHRGEDGQSHVMYIKGAVEKILERCADELSNNDELNGLNKENVHKTSEEMARNGLRVLAFAKRILPNSQDKISHHDAAGRFTFLGLQAMIDPPRREVIEAVQKCQAAGIRVKMITGDHVLTAAAIARQIGLQGGDHPDEKTFAITGKKLEHLSDEELIGAVDRLTVFARVAPEQKLRLVKALQARGCVVAMTGDGVNDAPALKQANIGIAMGIAGTDVAKGAADMLLTDDNFSSIEAAVEEGRCIFDNLTKFIVWTLPTNAGEAMILLTAILLGMSLPALPVQLLWINMVTAVFLGLMLVFEPKEKYLMQRPPRDPEQPILTFELLMRTGLVVLLMLIGAYWLFWHAQHAEGVSLAEARTMVIDLIVVVEIFYLFNCRSLTQSMFAIGPFTNLWVIGGSIAMVSAQLLFTYSPVMNRLFHSAPIGLKPWLQIVAIAAGIYLIVELEKWLRFKFKKA
ncbi:MAG: HAD-IC family P-type ATPase, partial [Candidatus Omnitrophica bacterium]|nr:HAD-IC family P-type ATPase [Candidatus Omnitrophota bacterium]